MAHEYVLQETRIYLRTASKMYVLQRLNKTVKTCYLNPANQTSVCVMWLMRQGVSVSPAGRTRWHCFKLPFMCCACDMPVSPSTPICSHRWPHYMQRRRIISYRLTAL